MPGMLSWDEMNWMFPDYEETGLIYHGTPVRNLDGIFRDGLIPRRAEDPDDRHDTIYDALHGHRPDFIPKWVDARRCIFAYINRTKFKIDRVADGAVTGAILGINAERHITERTWVGITRFSDWLYCPEEAGYFDTPDREEYFRAVVEPVCASAYWRMSLPFDENLRLRHDHLLYTQGHVELLVCVKRVDPDLLSLEALKIEGPRDACAVVRNAYADLFRCIESKFREGAVPSSELAEIAALAS